jgi:transketolase
VSELREHSHSLRELALEMALRSGECHIASAFSCAEILTVLYRRVLREPHGDRFLLSKGHAASALYAALVLEGVLPEEETLAGYCQDGGLAGHPERGVPGVAMTGGSLGQGPSIAVGYALADRADAADRRTFCLVGDGELNEGAVWEAIALAGHLGLANLTLIVDANGRQGLGETVDVLDLDAIDRKVAAFGWEARVVGDGHDHEALHAALAPAGRPLCVVARTQKGRGLDLLEQSFEGHYRSFRPHERELAFAALARGRAA